MSGKKHKQRRREGRGQDAGHGASGHASGSASDRAYQARVSAVLGGQRVQPGEHGLTALWRCNVCGRPWLADSSAPHGARLRLPQDELERLAGELGADLATLPYATCRICSATHGVGELGIDEYARGAGYGITWEGVEPPGAHIIITIMGERWALAARGMTPPHASVVTNVPRVRALLSWLESLPTPSPYRPFTAEDAREMGAMNPPGHGAPDTDGWTWRGGFWRVACPPLDDAALVTLAQALPPDEPYSMGASVAVVRQLARIMAAGHIGGE